MDQLTGLATLETDRLRIIQRAEYHRACMQGLSREAMLDYLEGVFEACPIMTGVFPRADELVIVFLKGGGDLLQAAAAGRCFPIGPLEAVPCVGEEQALLFGHLFGSPCPSGYPVFQKMPTVH